MIEKMLMFKPNFISKNSGKHSTSLLSIIIFLCHRKLSDRIEEADVDVQTDAFLDRPPSPLFIPQSTGKDIATQIEAGDVNFFVFFLIKFNAKFFSCLILILK
jgi:hypothetical protein